MEKQLVTINTQIEKSLYEMLRRVAFETRTSQRDIVEKALRYYFDDIEPLDYKE